MPVFKAELKTINDTITRRMDVLPIKTLPSLSVNRAYGIEDISLKKQSLVKSYWLLRKMKLRRW